jgi:hypothetical protein
MFQGRSCRDIVCSVTLSEYRAADEIMWKNVVEPERPQMTI